MSMRPSRSIRRCGGFEPQRPGCCAALPERPLHRIGSTSTPYFTHRMVEPLRSYAAARTYRPSHLGFEDNPRSCVAPLLIAGWANPRQGVITSPALCLVPCAPVGKFSYLCGTGVSVARPFEVALYRAARDNYRSHDLWECMPHPDLSYPAVTPRLSSPIFNLARLLGFAPSQLTGCGASQTERALRLAP